VSALKVGSPAGAKKGRFLLDTAGILEAPNLTASDCVTVPEVAAEVSPGGAGHRRLEQMLAAGLEVRASTNESLARVETVAKDAGNWGRLSAADVSILALALDLPDGTLVSDDYTVLDIAKRLKVTSQTIRTSGVTATKDWTARCVGCMRSYDEEHAGKPCPICGAEIRLKPRRR
jgi:rRNA maturation endonuclease Nob1